MNKKISEKDIKDWKEFTESNSKIENKDIDFVQLEKISNRTLDLHGLTLEIANKKIEQFIKSSFDKNVEKIHLSRLVKALSDSEIEKII